MRPFSHPNYEKNEQRCGDLEPCAICGKGVKETAKTLWVLVMGGGGVFAPADQEDPEDPGYMGFFPLGPACARKHRRFFAELGYREEGS
jgi:hypothetical protein